MLILVWFERSLHSAQVSEQLSLTVKTDDVTKGRKNVDPHGRLQAVQGRCGLRIKSDIKIAVSTFTLRFFFVLPSSIAFLDSIVLLGID